MRRIEDEHGLDVTLASLAREEAALRLRLGQLLEVAGRGAVFELGFSSVGAYAVERCERSVRWAEGARCLARRVEDLPALRSAMAEGKVSWSVAELLARVATPADEVRWLELAECQTVRQVRRLVREASHAAREEDGRVSASAAHVPGLDGKGASALPDGGCDGEHASVDSLESGDGAELCTLACTVDREDAWLFEATQYLLEQLGSLDVDAQCEALLSEAQTTLLAELPDGAFDLAGLESLDEAQQRRAEEIQRCREHAEASCERNWVEAQRATRSALPRGAGRRYEVSGRVALGMAPLENVSCGTLDHEVRLAAATLARHELELSVCALRFHRANGWRRLGYATETQYARERLGVSRSSLASRRALASRLEQLPAIAAALGAAQIGVEAALQLVRVATPKTQAVWLERARRRTIKHLREEVAAALTAVRLSGERDCPPPEDAELTAFHELERAVVGGKFGRSRAARGAATACGSQAAEQRRAPEPAPEARRAWWTMLGSLASWLEDPCQTSAGAPSRPADRARASAGRVTLRLRLSVETAAWWRALERSARPWLRSGMSWLRFACLCVWRSWGHLLDADVAYGHIYIRDRYRCTSPVCSRRDVTPHHLRFRSAGGSDDDLNLTSLCTWCHLHGIHEDRIRAHGTADCIRWELGPRDAPTLVVKGRERVAA